MTDDNVIDIKTKSKADLTEEKYYKHFVLTLEHPDSDEVMEIYVQRDWENNGPGVLVKGNAWIEEPTFEFDAGALSDIGEDKNEK